MTKYNETVIRHDIKKYKQLVEISADESKETFNMVLKCLIRILNCEGGIQTNDKRIFRKH